MFNIIPAIDLINGQCVRLEQGDFKRQTTYSSNPVEMARKWEEQGAKCIHIVDLDGAKSGKLSQLSIIEQICSSTSCQCELGGGIRSENDIQNALNVGVERVILGTILAKVPEFARQITSKFGTKHIIAGIDAHNGYISVDGWQTDSSTKVADLAFNLFDKGIRRFIYTDISTDGMFTGPNIEGTKNLCESIPDANFIASGGVGSKDHIKDLLALNQENLEGVIVGKALYDGRVNYKDLVQET